MNTEVLFSYQCDLARQHKSKLHLRFHKTRGKRRALNTPRCQWRILRVKGHSIVIARESYSRNETSYLILWLAARKRFVILLVPPFWCWGRAQWVEIDASVACECEREATLAACSVPVTRTAYQAAMLCSTCARPTAIVAFVASDVTYSTR